MIGCIFWEYFVKTWVIFSFMLLHISKNSGRNKFKLASIVYDSDVCDALLFS